MNIRTPIIPVSAPQCHRSDWKSELKSAFQRAEDLLRWLEIDEADLPFTVDFQPDFRLRVPKTFAAKMKKGNVSDPLLLQVLATTLEKQSVPGYDLNPLEESSSQASGLLHKYHGRVLLVLTGGCAVNCRYCFRRHFPYQDNAAIGDALTEAVEYIQKDTSLTEVILSGGDPLMLDDQKLSELVYELENIHHLKRLRIHSRLPVVIPSRVTSSLVRLLENSHLKVSLVLHINHPNEIDRQLADSLRWLQKAGITLLNQAVLLKNINDNSEIQINLAEKLFACGVLPYYLHLLDPVAGAAHFDVPEAVGKRIIARMRSILPGYLVPRLARELAGKDSKTVLAG